MPLPLLIPVAFALAGAFGVGKAGKAGMDNHSAKKFNNDADRNIRNADRTLESRKDAVNAALEDYGRQKLNALDKPLHTFVELFGELKNVELSTSPDFGALAIGDFTAEAIKEISTSCSLAAQTLSGLATGTGGGALVAFGAYNGTMLLASAGTGTAISTLGGAAATNATLAWLGGGTLASGGLGMAGGTIVLGTLVAGPALLIFGAVLGAKAEKKLADARSNYEESKRYEAELGLVTEKLQQILEVTLLAQSVIGKLAGRLRRSNKKLKLLIEEAGADYSVYTDEQKHVVFLTVKYAQLLKGFIDVPLLTEDGELDGGTPALIGNYQKELTA